METLLAQRGPEKKFREMNARIVEGLKEKKGYDVIGEMSRLGEKK